MKRISAFFASAFILFFFSCNNSGNKKEETKVVDTTTATTVVTAPVFTPFKVLIVRHSVTNFDKWKTAYLSNDSLRQAYGISSFVMGRELSDSNMVFVIDKMTDFQKAKEFAALPMLKEAMKKAGVTGAPTFSYVDVIRNDDTKIDQKDRIMVVHKVKNFDTWLKAYDSEGKKAREGYGLIDRALGREMGDSNMVHIVFAVTDMAKAKARMASEDLKKLMTDAGVIGAPKIYYYRLVN